jgi:DNA modification methylase
MTNDLLGRGIERSLGAKLKAKGRRRRDELRRSGGRSVAYRNDLTPKLELVELQLAELQAGARKYRKHGDAQIGDIAASIGALGFCAPILIDAENRIVDGEARLEAARRHGLETAPCIRVSHLSKKELRVLRLALNRMPDQAEWDIDELKDEFEELILDEAPLEVSGFMTDEIDFILEDEPEAFEKGPLAPAANATAVARLGDVFHLGRHRIICGNATEGRTYDVLMKDDHLAALVSTDVPYNCEIDGFVSGSGHREFVQGSGEMSASQFAVFNETWMMLSSKYLRDGGILGSWIDWRGQMTICQAALKLGLEPLNFVVWSKTNAGMGSFYRSQHELLPLFKKPGAAHVNNIQLGKRGRWRSNVWAFPGASAIGSDARRGLQDHPTVKPTAMLQDALLDMTDRGDIVIDCFLGSGSTLIAAERCGRICRGVELDPLYVDVIIRRYQEVTGDAAVLVETGERFVDLARRRLSVASERGPSREPEERSAAAPELSAGEGAERKHVKRVIRLSTLQAAGQRVDELERSLEDQNTRDH